MNVRATTWRYRANDKAVWQYAEGGKPVLSGWIVEPLFDADNMAEAVLAVLEMVRLADMGLDEALQEPEENGSYAAYQRAKRFLEDAPSPAPNLRGDDASREAVKQAADKMLQKTGWKPGDKFSFHSVSELMTALAFTQVKLLAEENDHLRKMLAGCDWYWPEDDTSSDACADGPWQIAENIDAQPGEVFGYSRGGIVETRYYGFLDAAEDAGSDDQFEADEPTREAAEAKMAAELQRRAALAAEAPDND